MKTQSKPTHQYLSLTADEYEAKRYELYYLWCANLANNHRVDVQCLLANTAMANYYSDQFLELEYNFRLVAQLLDGLVDKGIMTENYNLIMIDIHTNYPKPLIEAAKKLKIVNQNFNQN